MAPTDKVAVTMTRRSWTLLHSIVCDHLVDLVDEIEGTFGDGREPLEAALKDILQKWLPVLYIAADKTEWDGVVEENHKNVQKLAGLVVPEQYEDMAKQLVFFLTEEMKKGRRK